MSVAVLGATAAAVAGAAAVTEWTAARVEARARPRRAPTGDPIAAGPLTALLLRLGRTAGLRAPRDLAIRLEAAGLDGARARDLTAVKVGMAVVAAGFAAAFGGVLPGRLGVATLAAAPAGAYVLPDLVLRRRTRARAATLARELPDVLDLLRVAVQSGLSPGRAMGEVGRRATGVLAGELADASRRVELGVALDDVLRRLGGRCPAPAVTALVHALRRAGRHGAPLAPTLAALAADARAERGRRLREQAARAAPKIQLVVALGLVPGSLLMMGALLLPRVVAP